MCDAAIIGKGSSRWPKLKLCLVKGDGYLNNEYTNL